MIPVDLYIVDCCPLSRISNEIYFTNMKNKNSYSCKMFDDVGDCINSINKNNTKVINLDINFWGVNGIEKIRAIKRKYPDAKIIIYTSREDVSSILASLSNGASTYILKRKRKDLKNIIDKVLKNELCMDLRIATNAFLSMPSANYQNCETLQENQKLKERLTAREIEVLKLLTDGKTNTQIADAIVISANTAKAHVGSIFSKLSVTDRVQAAVKAVKANIL